MTELERKPFISGIAGTAFVWIFIILLSGVYPLFFKEKEYKTIQITLNAAPVVEKQLPQSVKEVVPQPVKKTEAKSQKASAPAPVPKSESKSELKTASKPEAKTSPASKAKSAEAKAAPEQVRQEVLAQDPMAALNSKTAKKKTVFPADFPDFDDVEENVSSAKSQTGNPSALKNAFEGTAGSVSKSEDSSFAAASKTARDMSDSKASAETGKALSNIQKAQFKSSYGNNVSGTSSMDVSETEDGLAVYMDSGVARVLLEPRTPVINLSKEASDTVDTIKKLTVTFRVEAGGNVQPGSVKVIPEAAAGSLVIRDIREEILRWRFKSASGISNASFSFIIKKD